MMLLKFYFFMSFVLLCFQSGIGDVGTFFHVSDFHYDPGYQQHGDPKKYCRLSHDGKSHSKVGKFGYLGKCDVPKAMIESAIAEMKRVEPNPDFIIWTGDSGRHKDTNASGVVSDIAFVTNSLKAAFPDVPLLPVWGNNDFFPKNDLPDSPNTLYNATIALWSDSVFQGGKIPDTIYKAAYYSTAVPNTDLFFLGLNTNLYEKKDEANFTSKSDPGGQFAWLEAQLQTAKSKGRKVYIAGHIAPGFRAKSKNPGMTPEYNSRFLRVTNPFSDIIVAMFFGHYHRDQYRVLPGTGDAALTPAPILLAPAVTTWKGGNNPGIRTVKYDRRTGEILDFTQYYTDIAEANAAGKVTWMEEYTFSSAYSVSPITGKNLQRLTSRMMADNSLFQQYFRRFSVNLVQSECTGKCRRRQFCALLFLDTEGYKHCYKTFASNERASPLVATATAAVHIASVLFSIASVLLSV